MGKDYTKSDKTTDSTLYNKLQFSLAPCNKLENRNELLSITPWSDAPKTATFYKSESCVFYSESDNIVLT